VIFLTAKKPTGTIKNAEMFRLRCCDCGLVHEVTIEAPQIPAGTPLRLTMKKRIPQKGETAS
jgi:hypothetical protein